MCLLQVPGVPDTGDLGGPADGPAGGGAGQRGGGSGGVCPGRCQQGHHPQVWRHSASGEPADRNQPGRLTSTAASPVALYQTIVFNHDYINIDIPTHKVFVCQSLFLFLYPLIC